MSNDFSARPVQPVELTEIKAAAQPGRKVIGNAMDVIRDVKVRVHVSAGQCDMAVKDLLELKENSLLTLDKSTQEPFDVVIDGKVVASGTLVAIGDQFGVRITEVYRS